MSIIPKIACIVATLASVAQINASDNRFFRSASNKVWSQERPEFNPSAELSDSIFDGAGAVVIARYVHIDARRVNEDHMVKQRVFGIPKTEAIKERRLNRTMVKILDEKALERHSSFDYHTGDRIEQKGYVLGEIKTAFGARIYHPDGTMTEVDTSEAFDLTEGKNDNKIGERIAIPGLGIGDVLDYFEYRETYIDELPILPETIELTDTYPIRHFALECDFGQDLTIEYGAYNGAPLLPKLSDTHDTYQFGITIENTPGVDVPEFFNRKRQIPFLKMFILNNNSHLAFKPNGIKRAPGIFPNPMASTVMSDLGNYLAKIDQPASWSSNIVSTVRKWAKTHPEATEPEIIDAAWLASLHFALDTKDATFNTVSLSALFADVLGKLKIKSPVFIGATDMRKDTPVIHKVRYTEPQCFVRAGARDFIFPAKAAYAPGELPASYQGEQAYMFSGKRSDAGTGPIDLINLPVSTPRDNSSKVTVNVVLDPDDTETTAIDVEATCTGTDKFFGSLFNDYSDICTEAAKYLGIPASKNSREATDSVDNAKLLKKLMNADVSMHFSREAKDITSAQITCRGLLPGQKLSYAYSALFDGLLKHAADNLVFNIGVLASDGGNIDEDQRIRDVDAYLDAPVNRRTDVIVPVPDGYSVDQASLTRLNRNVSNSAGSFFSQARISDDGRTLHLSVNRRNPLYIVPVDLWPQFIELADAEADFANATVILNHD